VVVVFVVHRQFAQSRAGKFAAAAAADPREQLQRTLAVSRRALIAVPVCLGDDAVEFGGVGSCGVWSGALCQDKDSAPCRQGALVQGLAGTGCFLGFFASLVLRCCPLAMVILLVVTEVEDTLLLRRSDDQAGRNARR
jgi:hypothetical protein